MRYWQRLNPAGAVSDLAVVWKENPYRWRVLAVSCALSGLMFYGFVPESQRAEPRPPTVTWITTFEPGRTDLEIAESNEENQVLQDERRAEMAAREARRKEIYRAIGRASGIDVEAAEARFRDEEASPPAKPTAAAAQP